MSKSRKSSTLLLLAVLAGVGYLLVTVPPRVIDGYRKFAELNATAANLYLATVGTGAVVLLAVTTWILVRLIGNSWRKARRSDRRGRDPSRLTRREQETELKENIAQSGAFADDARVNEPLRDEIHDSVASLERKQQSCKLEIVAFGTISSGKSSLLNALAGRDVFRSDVAGGTTLTRSEIPWPGADRVVLADTPGLAEVRGETRATTAADAAREADLVLFVVDGPLKAYEVDLLTALGEMEKRIVVCLNKEDWFAEAERDELLAQIARQVAPAVAPDDVVAVRARPGTRRRVRVLPDGSQSEETITSEADIEPLATRMLQIVQQDGSDLLLANLLLLSRGLVEDARRRVTATLDARADELISKYMWAAGSAAAVNPIPLLDLAGGTAITVKMVLDLARVYRQDIDSDTVVRLLGQLGKSLIAMLGAAAATPAVAAGAAALLKTVPGIGTIAGGLVQGLVQALVTRWIGRVFCEYFRGEMRESAGGLAELAQRKWDEVTQPDQLRKLIQAGRQHLSEGNTE